MSIESLSLRLIIVHTNLKLYNIYNISYITIENKIVLSNIIYVITTYYRLIQNNLNSIINGYRFIINSVIYFCAFIY